jgi:hypothetical protein
MQSTDYNTSLCACLALACGLRAAVCTPKAVHG